jgi:hypothetical protein
MTTNSTASRKSANCVVLYDWYLQPVHCPFCGVAQEPNEENPCKHLLYIIASGNFVFRSPRFDANLPSEANDIWPEFSREDKKKLGEPITVANAILEALPNGTEFEISGPSDSAFLGFAAIEDELCGWGRNHQSPYEPDVDEGTERK